MFFEFLGPKAGRDILDISRRDIVDFCNSLIETKSTDAANRYLKIVRMIFKAARRDEYILQNPAQDVEVIKDRDGDEGGRRARTVPEIRAVLAIADPEWQSLIEFGLYTGQRLGDLARLRFSNIDLEQDVVRLVSGKIGKRLSVPIAAPLREHILSLSHPDDPHAALILVRLRPSPKPAAS